MKAPLLEINKLTKNFWFNQREVKVIQNLSLSIQKGEIVGLGGESGCGKSTLGKLILRLIEPTSGSIRLNGCELVGLCKEPLRNVRRHMQMIFQNPAASLNPLFTIEEILSEPFRIQTTLQKTDRLALIAQLLEKVGLNSQFLKRYPHELSGGQKQRIAIARALALNPELIVCDEPFSALDVSVQVQIIQLLKDLQRELGLAYLIISHDLSVLRYLSHRMAIMYLGQIVEIGPTQAVYANPIHPYTKALLSAVPVPDPKVERLKKPIVLKGEIPSLLSPPTGCPFHTRCPLAKAECRTVVPEWREVNPHHFVACHFGRTAV